jgi:hypothetical protein
MRQSLAAQCGRSLSMEEEQPFGRRRCLLWLLRGAEFAGEEDERVFVRRGVQRVDLSYDDPVVAGGCWATISHSRVASASVIVAVLVEPSSRAAWAASAPPPEFGWEVWRDAGG